MDSNKRYTIADVASMMGVSRGTVSRALNGSPGVGSKLREEIVAFAHEIGYKPNSIAQSLSKGRTDIIGLMFGDVRNPFYAELTFYIQTAFENSGYNVMIFNTEYSIEKELKVFELAEQLCLAGLIVFTALTNIDKSIFESLRIPIVFVNRSLELQNYDYVQLDNFKAGYIATMHLIEQGHRRIGFVKGQSLSSASSQRFEGFCQALKTYYLPLKEEDVTIGNLRMDSGYELAGRFFDRESHPSALVIANDMMALGFIDRCNEMQISVPDQLSIVSFDNIVFAKMHGIELTTVSQNEKEMGERAVELMIRRIEEPESEYRRVILEPSLIVRNTTKQI